MKVVCGDWCLIGYVYVHVYREAFKTMRGRPGPKLLIVVAPLLFSAVALGFGQNIYEDLEYVMPSLLSAFGPRNSAVQV